MWVSIEDNLINLDGIRLIQYKENKIFFDEIFISFDDYCSPEQSKALYDEIITDIKEGLESGKQYLYLWGTLSYFRRNNYYQGGK